MSATGHHRRSQGDHASLDNVLGRDLDPYYRSKPSMLSKVSVTIMLINLLMYTLNFIYPLSICLLSAGYRISKHNPCSFRGTSQGVTDAGCISQVSVSSGFQMDSESGDPV